jgi:MoaA/NifB/PqqE/SkfB family radical SAM enzyme
MSDIFCIAPFVNFSTTTQGKVRLCCQAHTYQNLSVQEKTLDEIWTSAEYQTARNKFIANEWPDECVRCRNNEDNGISSRREYENSKWRHIDRDEIIKTPRIITYDLRLGHTCNLKCIMCTPINSSLWVSEHEQYEHLIDHKTNTGHKWADNSDLLENIKRLVDQVEMFYFSGGEPLLIKKHEELIRFCIDNGYASNIKLIYDTNATMITPKWIELWENFQNVQINLSIDGGREVVEYVRYPVKYDNLINSLELLKTSNKIDVALQMALGAYNIFEVEKIVELKEKYQCKQINISILNWPEFMQLDVLTDEQKLEVKHKYRNFDKVERVMTYVNSIELNGNNPEKMIEYFKKIDHIRGLDYKKVFKWL